MNPRERKLLLFFVAALVLAASWVGFLRLRSWNNGINTEARSLKFDLQEREILLAESELWQTRAAWLEAQPVFPNQLTAETKLMHAVFEGANTEGLQVEHRRPLEPENSVHWQQTGVEIKVMGDIDSVIRWIHGLQQPDQFRAIKKLNIVPSADDPSILTCDLEVVRWYRPEVEA